MTATYNFEKATRIIHEKWSKGCPACGGHDFGVNDRIFAPIEVQGKVLSTDTAFPLLTVTCNNCFCTQFMSAAKAEIL